MRCDKRWWRRLAMLAAFGLLSGMAFPGDTKETPKRAHPRPELIRPALEEIATALMRDDVQTALAAVERLQEANPRLFVEDNDRFGESAKNLSQSLHKVLEGTKSYLHRGDVDEAFNEFVWVQRTCRVCHQEAQRLGLLPSEGPLWGPGAKRADSAQTSSPAP